ncbi:MAG: hypothetical protein LBT19_02535 [Candidatus Nomurabacteria bacterium]|jgi:hypothetical protein|nr:hypothetical protein [Candidatus Nomurabacteria bacterium]
MRLQIKEGIAKESGNSYRGVFTFYTDSDLIGRLVFFNKLEMDHIANKDPDLYNFIEYGKHGECYNYLPALENIPVNRGEDDDETD